MGSGRGCLWVWVTTVDGEKRLKKTKKTEREIKERGNKEIKGKRI